MFPSNVWTAEGIISQYKEQFWAKPVWFETDWPLRQTTDALRHLSLQGEWGEREKDFGV